MELRPMDAISPDAMLLDRLNREAFPDNERVDAEDLFAMAARGEASVLGIYEDDIFAGFFALRTYQGYIYLIFFAIRPEMRSRGLGGRALRMLCERYNGTQIAIDFEAPDECSPNNEQRVRRREFYLRSGFCETGLFMYYAGTEFEVVCSDIEFDRAGFERMIAHIHAVYPPFDPKIYTKK